MARGYLRDEEWALIGALLAERGRWARPAMDNRRFLDGMLYVLRAPIADAVDNRQLAVHVNQRLSIARHAAEIAHLDQGSSSKRVVL